jgi:hypothetical protein
MTTSFPQFQAWDGSRTVVSFPADHNGNRIVCAISLEALQDNFGGNGVSPIACFQAHRGTIEAKVVHLISTNRFEADGSIFIRIADGT